MKARLRTLKRRITRRRLQPPLGFMHIPKAGGTGMIDRLETILRPRHLFYGFDRTQFGGFTDLGSLPASMRRSLILDAARLPRDIDILAGHVAPSTIRDYAPDCRLITCLRIPQSRLLSHYQYWRGYDDARLAGSGGWGRMIALAQLDLAAFLSRPAIACQTDNLITRMLLWPHAAIPAEGFIDPSNDASLLAEAHARLARFSHVDIIENPGFDQALDLWLHATYGRSRWARLTPARRPRLNEASDPRIPSLISLADQVQGQAGPLLQTRSRLDLALWFAVAQECLPTTNLPDFVASQIARTIERYDRLIEPVRS